MIGVVKFCSLERAAVVAHVRSLGVEEIDVVAALRDAELGLEDVRDRGARGFVGVGVDRAQGTEVQESGGIR